jgi:uncharacterized protein (DUF983 family)
MSGKPVSPPKHPHPTWPQLMGRALTKKCPRCGAGHIYDSWFRMKERCPTCGILFEREPGFFVGAYLVNFAVVIVLLFVACMGFVAWKAANPDAGVAVPLTICLVISLVVPVFFYPYSRTIWAALHIGGAPIEPHEEEAAEAFLRGDPVPPPSPINGAIGPRRGRAKGTAPAKAAQSSAKTA